MARRSQKFGPGEKGNGHQAVGVEIPIEDRQRGARMISEHSRIEREADERGDKQTGARRV